jgi:hypothetical protein
LAHVGVSNSAHKPMPQQPRTSLGVLFIAVSSPLHSDDQSIAGFAPEFLYTKIANIGSNL